jgi:ComF family protein
MNPIERILSFIAPHLCLVCGSEGVLLCSACATHLPTIPKRCYACHKAQANWRVCPGHGLPLAHVRTCASYDGTVKQLVGRLKFERARSAATTIAQIMAAMHADIGPHIITHVPTATTRVRQRGYDQAALIARALARELRMPYLPLLARTSQHRQLGQSRLTRKTAMEGLFRVTSPLARSSLPILLVDDVMTTGASIEAAAKALRARGATTVDAITFAAA